MFFTKTLPLVLALLCLAAPATAAVKYVDNAATGANNGTSWANAWTSLSAISGLSAGDVVYISGGTVSKTYATPSSWSPTGGTSANPITYRTGLDAGHNGRVIFDVAGKNFWIYNVNNVRIRGDVNGVNMMSVINASDAVVYSPNTANINLAYIDFVAVGGMRLDNSSGVEIDHCNFTKLAHSTGILDYIIYGLGGGSFDVNKVHNNTILIPARSSDSAWGDDCIKWASGTSFYSNHFKVYLTNYPGTQHCDVFQVAGSNLKIYANSFENIGESWIYHDVTSSGQNISNVRIYNNVFWWSFAPASGVARGMDIQPEQSGANNATFTDCFVANNTFVDVSFYVIRWNNAGGYTRCYVANNLFYNCSTPFYGMSPVPSGMNIWYNRAVPGPQGTSTLSPANSVGPGGTDSKVSFVSYTQYGANNNFHLIADGGGAIDAGTNALSTYFTTDLDGGARPTGAAWDIGAYEYNSSSSGGGSSNLPPSVSAIGLNASDVDPITAGLQVYEGTVVQFTGSATDPNNDALTWQWLYSINGGSQVVYQSGSGPFTSINFNFGTGNAGRTYVWTLVFNDGQATSQSQYTMSVEAPPSAGQGLTIAATNGMITAPFTILNGYVYQPQTTTTVGSGGTATYNFVTTNAGSYVIQATLNAPDAAANSLFVNIDALPVDPAMIWDIVTTSGFEQRLVSWRGTGTADNNQYVPKIFNLSAGTHQIVFVGREANTQLQSFSILQLPSAPQNLRVLPTVVPSPTFTGGP